MRELALHVLDVLENSLEAGATEIELTVDEELAADRLTIIVRDNGRGMDPDTARRALDPFFTTRTTRHVGLGLPLFAAAARRCAGGLQLESAPGRGTRVTATFQHSHLDRAPLGDMTGTLLAFLLSERAGSLRFIYGHRLDGREFCLDTDALRAELGDVPFSHPLVRDWLHDYIAEGEAELRQ
jgi:anti-sigma regulatory factor (Ser/Thr protein kinase)